MLHCCDKKNKTALDTGFISRFDHRHKLGGGGKKVKSEETARHPLFTDN